MTTRTLFEALQAMPDQHTRKGRRFPLAAIVAIALAAMLSGANDLMVRTKLPSCLDRNWPGITAICRIVPEARLRHDERIREL